MLLLYILLLYRKTRKTRIDKNRNTTPSRDEFFELVFSTTGAGVITERCVYGIFFDELFRSVPPPRLIWRK